MTSKKERLEAILEIFGVTYLKWVWLLPCSDADKASYAHGLRSMCNAYIDATDDLENLIFEAKIASSYYDNKYGAYARPLVDRIDWFTSLLEIELEKENIAG